MGEDRIEKAWTKWEMICKSKETGGRNKRFCMFPQGSRRKMEVKIRKGGQRVVAGYYYVKYGSWRDHDNYKQSRWWKDLRSICGKDENEK